ncbi:hypothetical protein CA838_02045 [Eikenella corrodens]|nr:hypothetical protein CA838_02045 [Eikenella corrodens]
MAALSGVDTIREVAKRQKKTLLAFSTGKDAIAAWLAMRGVIGRVARGARNLVRRAVSAFRGRTSGS